MGMGRSCKTAILLLAIAKAARAASYDALVYPLTPPTGITVTSALNLNAANAQAVGWGQVKVNNVTSYRGILWNGSTGSAIDLTPSSMTGSDVNATDGVHQVGGVSGLSTGGQDHAVIWSSSANAYVDLNPTLLANITNSDARGIGGGQEIGNGGNTSSSSTHPILWSGTAASAIDLNPTNLTTTFVGLYGNATDGSQQVGAGNTSAENAINGWHALLWSGAANTAVDLTPTNFPTLVNSWANGVGGNQQVGEAFPTQISDPFFPGPYTPMLWTGTGASAVSLYPTDLSYLGPSGADALATNGSQQVGFAYTSINGISGEHALVWSGTGASAVDLNNFLPTAGTWNGSNAKSIDATGDVFGIATGTFGGLNSSFGVDWVPTNSSSAIVVAAGETYQFAANPNSTLSVRSIGGLTINTSGSAVIPAASNSSSRQLISVGGTGLLIAGSSGAWTGKLDLANNDLDLPASVTTLANVTNQIRQAYDGGKWDGSAGITSSSAAANATHLTTLGVMQNNASGTALYTSSHPFDTITPGAGDVLVKYTYYGDTNLDGQVNSADYARIDAGYLSGAHGWFNGDFNYDGVVNGSDYTLIDNAFNKQGAVISSEIAATTLEISPLVSVPEPSGAVLLAAGLGMCLSRRNRKSFSLRRRRELPVVRAPHCRLNLKDQLIW
jgi:hypothetical protein